MIKPLVIPVDTELSYTAISVLTNDIESYWRKEYNSEVYSNLYCSETTKLHKSLPVNSVTFLNCIFHDFNLDSLNVEKICFSNCTINRFVSRFSHCEEFSFKKGKGIIEEIQIDSKVSRLVLIEESTINKVLLNRIQGDVKLLNNVKIEELKIGNASKISSFFFISDEGKTKCIVNQFSMFAYEVLKLNVDRINCTNCIISSKIENILSLRNSDLGSLILNTLSTKLLLSVDSCTLDKLEVQSIEIKDFNVLASTIKSISFIKQLGDIVRIQYTKIDEINFHDLKLIGELAFEYSNVSKGIKFFNSDMKNSNFNSCNVAGDVVFENSRVQDMTVFKTDFPKRVVFSTNREKTDYGSAQLFFGQLQHAYSKQGDNIRASEMKTLELEAHFHNLPWKKFGSKLNLLLNSLSNDFGRSWTKGVLFTFVFGFLFFQLILFSSPEYVFSLRFNGEMWGTYLKFMNPLRQIDLMDIFTLKILTFNGISYTLDFLGRVFVAYGYYQTIQAFRRFGKFSN